MQRTLCITYVWPGGTGRLEAMVCVLCMSRVWFMFLSLHVCMCECVRACVYVSVCLCVCVCVYVCK
jgi:hypothetical protein